MATNRYDQASRHLARQAGGRLWLWLLGLMENQARFERLLQTHFTVPGFPERVGDLTAALRAIRAKVLLMPGETDLYFRVADNAAELPHLAHAELRPIPSIWGHRAGNPVPNPADVSFIKQAVRDWLAR